jgi:hypothetical protein
MSNDVTISSLATLTADEIDSLISSYGYVPSEASRVTVEKALRGSYELESFMHEAAVKAAENLIKYSLKAELQNNGIDSFCASAHIEPPSTPDGRSRMLGMISAARQVFSLMSSDIVRGMSAEDAFSRCFDKSMRQEVFGKVYSDSLADIAASVKSSIERMPLQNVAVLDNKTDSVDAKNFRINIDGSQPCFSDLFCTDGKYDSLYLTVCCKNDSVTGISYERWDSRSGDCLAEGAVSEGFCHPEIRSAMTAGAAALIKSYSENMLRFSPAPDKIYSDFENHDEMLLLSERLNAVNKRSPSEPDITPEQAAVLVKYIEMDDYKLYRSGGAFYISDRSDDSDGSGNKSANSDIVLLAADIMDPWEGIDDDASRFNRDYSAVSGLFNAYGISFSDHQHRADLLKNAPEAVPAQRRMDFSSKSSEKSREFEK